MKKKPIDHISTLAKEEKLELEMMKMLFSKNKQKTTLQHLSRLWYGNCYLTVLKR